MSNLIQKLISKSSRGTVIFLPKIYREKISLVEKYAQIGQISSGIIHDLISPITVLNMQIEMLDENIIKNPEYLRTLRAAVSSIESYSSLIKDYISGNTDKEFLILDDEIQKAIELISYKAVKENIQIQFIRNPGIQLYANKVHIYQIAISVISNAIESFRESDQYRKIIIKLEKIGDQKFLTVKDHGEGIKHIRKIFTTFYTTKKSSGGTGIGLSSVKHLVEKELNGEIEIKSELNKGTEFKIIF